MRQKTGRHPEMFLERPREVRQLFEPKINRYRLYLVACEDFFPRFLQANRTEPAANCHAVVLGEMPLEGPQ